LRMKRNYQRAAPTNGSDRNRVLVPFDFGRRQLNGDAAIRSIAAAFGKPNSRIYCAPTTFA